MYRSKYNKKYGELVICCDNRNYWRKTVFPFYKANRKKMRDTSDYDWNGIFDGLNQVKTELYEHFPYKVIEVCTCEADDIIAVIVSHSPPSPTLILSGDKDFMQLQKFEHVEQYSPMQKKFLRCNKPEQTLKEHILRGDKSDGIPNILSDDDSIVNEDKRQSPLTRVKVEMWLGQQSIQLEDQTLQEHYNRNEKLVDLTKVPENLTKQIKDAYDNSIPNSRNKLFGYMMEHRLKNLMEYIEDF
jgi:5'-3' exonuclease